MAMMNEHTFAERVEHLFLAIEHWLEASSDDVDFESNEGRLKIQIGSAQWVLSKQTALFEIWLASPSGAFHFHLSDDNRWLTNAGDELIQTIAKTIAQITSLPLNPLQFKLEH